MITSKIHKLIFETTFFEYFDSFEHFFASDCLAPKSLLNNSLKFWQKKFMKKYNIEKLTLLKLLRYSFYSKFLKPLVCLKISEKITEIMG